MLTELQAANTDITNTLTGAQSGLTARGCLLPL
jgi:hypothetical protein